LDFQEFDKMDDSDRTSIHEVMEQQTVSIAKAGIVATLNARTSVLAAANPLYGRYNRHKSLSDNINLPNSLLSRFDLLFLILDVADVDKDMALARHVALVHENEGRKATDKENKRNGEQDMADDDDSSLDKASNDANGVVPPLILREYIARARQHHPFIPPEVAPYVIEAYVSLRQQGVLGNRRSSGRSEAGANDQTVMTARQLLSMLRISQAVARLRFSDYVAREDVDEAIRLTHMSKASLTDDNHNRGGKNSGGFDRGQPNDDVMSRIFLIIRDYSTVTGNKVVELKLCEAMVLRKGFTVQQLEMCLEEYEALDIIQINSARTHVTFVDHNM
jgi:DNA replication licensing factor MCM7